MKPQTIKILSVLRIACLLLIPATLHAEDDGRQDSSAKYSPLYQINKDNVAELELAWEYHTGEKMQDGDFASFQDRPTLIEGNLIICSMDRRLIALDPATGKERWVYDHKAPRVFYRKCRGVSHWTDKTAEEGTHCRTRLILGTPDNRLVAIDARDGKPCSGFGENGAVPVPTSKPLEKPAELMISANPAIVNDVIVVGSYVADNQRVDSPSGRVMAYNARTGQFVWQFDPIPRDPNDPAMKTWENGTDGIGAANVWTDMAVDNELDLVYLPTSSASIDFFGGDRPGDNDYSTSIVAVRGSTGELVWYHQLVHHNVFDYDLPAQPMLIDFPVDGKLVPALVQHTKMGLIFVFDRATGEPLVPIVERPVPQTGKVPEEVLSPTQPFPEGMPTIMPQGYSMDDVWGFTFIDRWNCEDKIAELNYGPIYTPPSEKGTVFSPANGGGPNWGSGGYDPDSKIMVVPSNRVPLIVKLVRKEGEEDNHPKQQSIETRGSMVFPNKGAPYKAEVSAPLSNFGAPCAEPPWAALTAVDMEKREIVWEVPLGDIRKFAPFGMEIELGTPGAGGPLVTAGGLAFIGYTLDDVFRAFDLHTGDVLWEAELPAAGTAVPVTYEVNGEQYVVIPAGGHSMYQSTMSDSVMAYKLKR